MTEISKYRLLNASQEKLLGNIVQAEVGQPAKSRRWMKARDALVQSNLKLVVKLANNYISSGLALEDLVFEGNTGLIKAAEKYSPTVGTRFSTYATYWILNSIFDAIHRSLPVKIPIKKAMQLSKIRQSIGYNGEDDDVEQIAKDTGLGVGVVRKTLKVNYKVSSLQQPNTNEEEGENRDINLLIADAQSVSGVEVLEQKEQYARVKEAIEKLPEERQRRVLHLRFGFGETGVQTLGEVAEELKISKERVRQIQNKAMAEVRSYLCQKETEEDNNAEMRTQERLNRNRG